VQVIEKLFRERWGKFDGLGALILTPTRELALQIFDELRKVRAMRPSVPCRPDVEPTPNAFCTDKFRAVLGNED